MDENKAKLTSEQEEEKVTGGAVNSPSAELHISQCPVCGGCLLSNRDPLTGQVIFKCLNCGFTNT